MLLGYTKPYTMDFHPKLIIFDLDGTLAESKERMTAEMGELLGELLSKVPVAVISGASFAQFENQFFPAIPDNAHIERLFIFPTNAARCFVFKNHSWHPQYDHAFTPHEKERIMAALTEAMAKTGFTEPPTPVWGERIEDREAEITFSALGQQAPIDEKRKWDPDRSKRRPLYDELVRLLPDFSVGLNATTSIDITRKGINKAFGVHELVRISGIQIPQMLYVGDALEEGGNDSVVKETGIRTHEVFGPEETAGLMRKIIGDGMHKTV